MGSQSIRIVYVLGSARSGSTILSAILGMHPEIAAVGELARLTFDVQGEPRICSCGDQIWECERWQKVRELWEPRLSPGTLDVYTNAVARFSKPTQTPGLLWARLKSSSTLNDLLDYTELLLESIQSVFGRTIIIDSSKSFTRALLYSMMPGIDLKIIHLVRDVRGFIWSNLRRSDGSSFPDPSPGFSAGRSIRLAAYWNLMNLSCEWAASRADCPRMKLRYEDFVTRPRTSLLPLGEFIGVDLESVVEHVEAGHEVDFGHITSGSPARLSGPVRLMLDDSWHRAFTLSQQRLTWLSGLPLSSFYGYPIA